MTKQEKLDLAREIVPPFVGGMATAATGIGGTVLTLLMVLATDHPIGKVLTGALYGSMTYISTKTVWRHSPEVVAEIYNKIERMVNKNDEERFVSTDQGNV